MIEIYIGKNYTFLKIMNRKIITSAFKVTLPVFFGYLTLGIAFGLVLTQANYPWFLAPVMSIIMFAGAAQFIAVGLFAAGTPLYAILITEALVNIRHIVYGLSLISKYKNCKKWKPYLIFALTDETYSILTTTDVPENCDKESFFGAVSLLDQSYWVLGSTIGAIAGQLIPFDLTGVDFALTALFVVLTIEQIRKTKDAVPIIIGAIATLAAIIMWKAGLIASSNILIIALCAGIAAIFICKRKDYKDLLEDLNNKKNTEKEEN